MDKPVFSPMYELQDIRPLTAEIEMGRSFCGGLEDIGFYTDRWFLFYNQYGIGSAYYDEREMRRSGQIAFERFTKPSHRRAFAISVKNILTEICSYAKHLAGEELSKSETGVFLSLMEQGWNLEARVFALYNATQPQNTRQIEEAIKANLWAVTKSQESVDDILGILATPDRLSKIGREELDLLELALYIRKHELALDERKFKATSIEGLAEYLPNLEVRIAEHFNKYKTLMLGEKSWLPQIGDLYRSIEAKLTLSSDLLLKRRDELREYSHIVAENKLQMKKRLGLDENTIKMCDAAAFVGETRLWLRTDGWIPLIFSMIPLLKELARRKQLSVRELMFQTKEELCSLFGDRPLVSTSELVARAQADLYIMIVRDRNLRFCFGDEAHRTFAAMVAPDEADEETTLKGAPAVRGKVVGYAFVYKWGDDIHAALLQMTQGAILVAGQTRPQLMPLIRKAMGVVTDEGGITSHAAIVTREMGIPCVVGAKTATKRLRTGDLVELDATLGIVTVLARAGG